MQVRDDESGSMEGALPRWQSRWNEALLEIARRGKCEFFAIPFSVTGRHHVWQAPKPGQPDPQGLLVHLSHFYDNGTEPYSSIVKALQVIGSFRAGSFSTQAWHL